MSGVLLLHAWWGVNDDMRAFAARLRDEGFTVEMPDLYRGKTADTIAGAEALRDELEAGGDTGPGIQRARGDIDAAAARLRAQGPFGIVAWSLGVWYAWDFLERHPGEASALVVYYGTAGPPPAVTPPVLGHFGEQDDFEPREGVDASERAIRERGVAVTHHIYPGTKHWFSEPTRPEFDAAAADIAAQRTIEFLRRTVR